MSDEMEIANEVPNGARKESTEEMEMESPASSQKDSNFILENKYIGADVTDSCTANSDKKQVKIVPEENISKDNSNTCNDNDNFVESSNPHKSNNLDTKLSPPVFVNTNPLQQNSATNDCPFQKPTVCRTHSLGAGDPSPFTIRRRPARLSFANQHQSPSAFRRRKLKMQSPIRGDLADEMEDNVLKRCNSAPMLNEMNDIDARMAWHPGSVTPGSIRARRFSATVLSVHASPSAGSAKAASRLNQLKKEESLEGIQYKETAHEREVQTSIQMYHTCEELSLSDSHESLNGILSGDTHQQQQQQQPHRVTITSAIGATTPTETVPKSPLLQSPPVILPVVNKACPTRAIDFSMPGCGNSIPTPAHHHTSGGGGIPSPLTISPSTGLSLSPLPPSPTRNLGFSSTGKQCFSPSMQVPVPACLRPGSLSPSPSPTRRTFVTRRRSQSPCIVKPSVLGPIKRKYDSDSEGGCSPKRMFLPGSQAAGPGGGGVSGAGQNQHSDSLSTFPVVVTPFFPRTGIHRSHSLSSSSVDSDLNVSPSPPQNVVNLGFLPSGHPLVVSTTRENHSGSPFQSPLHTNPFLNTVGAHDSVRCSSPASSTCSSSSLEGIRDLQTYPQSHLVSHSISNVSNTTLTKPLIKERQPPTPSSTANISL